MPQLRDAHNPPSRPSIVSQRIAQLALAGIESEQIHSRPQSVARSTTRQTSAASAVVAESQIREHALDGSKLMPNQLAPLQIPVQEEAENVCTRHREYGKATASLTKAFISTPSADGRQTPTSRSLYEKQVTQLSPSLRAEAAVPSTPVRGRGLVRRTPRSSGYGVEQSFYFSPDRSRSQSKASGRRLTLEINMGTPDGKDIEKVVIKADMDVLDEN
jgi:hypothetical protein